MYLHPSAGVIVVRLSLLLGFLLLLSMSTFEPRGYLRMTGCASTTTSDDNTVLVSVASFADLHSSAVSSANYSPATTQVMIQKAALASGPSMPLLKDGSKTKTVRCIR